MEHKTNQCSKETRYLCNVFDEYYKEDYCLYFEMSEHNGNCKYVDHGNCYCEEAIQGAKMGKRE